MRGFLFMYLASELLLSFCCVAHLYYNNSSQQQLPLKHRGTENNFCVSVPLWQKTKKPHRGEAFAKQNQLERKDHQ